MLSPFLGWCILSDLFFGAGHAVYAKTGYTVDVYTPEGFIKILMTDVERQGPGAGKTLGVGGDCEGGGSDGGGGIWTVRKSRPH